MEVCVNLRTCRAKVCSGHVPGSELGLATSPRILAAKFIDALIYFAAN